MAEPRYDAHLSCGDTVSAHNLPVIGRRRLCIHCDASKVVERITDYVLVDGIRPAATVAAAPSMAGGTS